MHTSTHHAAEAPISNQRPALDLPMLEAMTPVARLSSTWRHLKCVLRWDRFLLPAQPHISVHETDLVWQGGTPVRAPRHWIDAKTGAEGVGVIALCAYVLDVSDNEAAWRLAKFMSIEMANLRDSELNEHGICKCYLLDKKEAR